MFRAAPQSIARAAVRAAPLRSLAPSRRAISTAPPTQKSRSWKSLAARVGIAGTLLYYYNTTDVFAEEPRQSVYALPETEVESEHLPTIESISEERKRRQAVQAQLDAQKQKQQETASAQQNAKPASGGEGGIEGLEEEADQQGAFNPETGEINWDCPCLGGMAHGPCGDEFKAAFSCFVYSTEEPKGMDCIDKFKDMQNCFRQYPEVYGSEIDSDADDEDDTAADLAASESTPATSASGSPSLSASDVSSDAQTAPSKSQQNEPKRTASAKPSSKPHSAEKVEANRRELGLVPENYRRDQKTSAVEGSSDTERANQAAQQTKSLQPVSESESVVPKAAFDAADENTKVLERK